jgi:hypothetical protein
MASERLSPAMRKVLACLRDRGRVPDVRPRSWSTALPNLEQRGLICLGFTGWEITPAGRALLEGGD